MSTPQADRRRSAGAFGVLLAAGGAVGYGVATVIGRSLADAALTAAAAYSLYLVVGREFGRRTDAMTAACWVAFGASGSSLARGAIGGTLEDPGGHALQILAYGVATAGAFGLTFAALARISASHTAVVSTIEALSTVLLAAYFLDEGITPSQGAGGLAILAAAAVIGGSHRGETAPTSLDPGGPHLDDFDAVKRGGGIPARRGPRLRWARPPSSR